MKGISESYIRHKKTGKIYYVIDWHVIDCTNSRDGTECVMYENDEGMKFVRERAEFEEKFEPYKII